MEEGRKTIAVALDLGLDYHRRMAIGVCGAAAIKEHDIAVTLVEGPPFPVRRLDAGRFDGVIARLAAHQAERELRVFAGLPIVRMYRKSHSPRGAEVSVDGYRSGQLAAEHLLDCGFRHLACLVTPSNHDLRMFIAGVRAVADDSGVPVHSCRETRPAATWLRGLPKPVGIVAGWDITSAEIVRIAYGLGLRIPDEVGVLGFGNDLLRCTLADVPLSSLDVAPETIGRTAAQLLVELMDGRAVPGEPILVPPRGIVIRESSDLVAGDDPLLTQAVAYIRRHACEGMRIGDLEPLINVSRRTLEIRFKRRFGRTLHDEIRRVQFRRACQLLAETDMPIFDVAGSCGFMEPARFGVLFRQAFGMPPSVWRRRFRTV